MKDFEIISSQGACSEAGMDVMYPDESDDRAIAVAKSVCAGCVVIDMCRDYALQRNEAGVWGGQTQHERHNYKNKLTRERRRGRPGTA